MARACRTMALVCAVVFSTAGVAEAAPYPARWIFLQTNFTKNREIDRAIELIGRAARDGINGVVVMDAKFATITLYQYDRPGHPFRRNAERFVRACRAARVDIIPSLPGISRANGGILAHDVNLAAGYPVRDAVFEVQGGAARIVPDPKARVQNGGFESADNHTLAGWDSQSAPGKATVVDNLVARSGSRSIRLEASGAERGMNRLSQWCEVTPHRCYRLSLWLRTDDLDPAGGFNLSVRGQTPTGMRNLTFNRFSVKSTQSWTRMDTVFNSLDAERVIMHTGLWGARQGRAWIDDVELTEIGLVNVLRRPGCPLAVKSADGKFTLKEGANYQRVEDPKLGRAGDARYPGQYERYHEPPSIRMVDPVPDGTRLLVSYYHPLMIHDYQVDCCLSVEKAHEIVEANFKRLNALFDKPKHYLMGYNELRSGGSCAACKAHGKTPGALLADHVRQATRMVRATRPDAELIVWHDLFDPHGNAKKNYYLIDGTLAESWKGLDERMIILVWSEPERARRMRFFAERGHRQVASANYDQVRDATAYTPTLLSRMDAVDRVLGAMFTTWNDRYDALSDFAKALREHDAPNHSTDAN